MIEPGSDPAAILTALDRHGVDYVLVGGYAANVHCAVRPTRHMDVAPATTADNLTRLIALRDLHAGIRIDELLEGLPFDTNPAARKTFSRCQSCTRC